MEGQVGGGADAVIADGRHGRRRGRTGSGLASGLKAAVRSVSPPLVRQIREDWRVNGRSWTKPGFHAIAVHRLGVWRRELPPPLRALVTVVYRALFVWVRNCYGIELREETVVGRRVRISHQGGIVIHPRAVLGDECLIRQNVTIGLGGSEVGDQRAPTLGRGVAVGAGAVLAGGIRIGDGARIGPNAVVTTDVPAGATVFAPPARIVQLAEPEPRP